MKNQTNQRKTVIVEPTVQWAIARRLMVHWALFCVTLFAVYTTLDVLLHIGETSPSTALRNSFGKQLPWLVTMAILMPLFLRDSLQLSQRFAGPIYRLRSALRELSRGENGRPLRFRDGDFWSELSGDFNLVRQRILDAEGKRTAQSVYEDEAARESEAVL